MIPAREGATWRVAIDPAWPGFAGHFPGDPILPAAELIEQALHCAADAGLAIAGIRKARFLQPVRPGDTLHWTLDPSGHARASRGPDLICEFRLTLDGGDRSA